jgi:uncharacterized protein YijF (DUF1287 family)
MYYHIQKEKQRIQEEKELKRAKKSNSRIIAVASLLMVIMIVFLNYGSSREGSQKAYSAKELGITEKESSIDMDKDGIDDYRDIMLGARAYVESKPEYKSKYYEGGYPDDNYGVCTDVIWHALKEAGYNLKEMVDEDIASNQAQYPSIEKPDPNIDFRRVVNLNVFLERNTTKLTNEFANSEEWQAGDIIVFKKHIAICSDKRNANGIPFLIHFDSKGAREANDIGKYKVVGHYRWKIVNQ